MPASAAGAESVAVHVVWRRRSVPAVNYTAVVAALPPAADGASPTLLPNVTLHNASSHDVTVVFQPPPGHSTVHLYYMPCALQLGTLSSLPPLSRPVSYS